MARVGASGSEERDWELEGRMKANLSECGGMVLRLPNSCSFLTQSEDRESQKEWKFTRPRSYNAEDPEYSYLGEFLEENLAGGDLPNLQWLTISHIERAADADELLWECLHHHQLTELSLEGCNLGKSLYMGLEFWAVPNLTVLNLNRTDLPWLPASVGRLKKLRTLSLNHNFLKTLPHTITFCTSLEELNLESNNFPWMPGFILSISSLKSLRRYGNDSLLNGAADLGRQWYNNFIVIVPDKTQKGSGEDETLGEVVPLKLLAVRSIMISRIDYWTSESLAPAICKILDMSQSQYKICDKCWVAKPLCSAGYRVRWLVESYLGLRYVPFEHYACCYTCAESLGAEFHKIQAKLKKEKDEEYRQLLQRYSDHEPPRLGHRRMQITETWRTDWSDGHPTTGRFSCSIL